MKLKDKYLQFERKCLNPNDIDAFYWLYSRISLPITFLLQKTPITANMVTISMCFVGLVGSLFLISSENYFLWIGVVLIFLAKLLDHTDGQLARIKKTFSKKGYFFDWVGSHLMELLIISSITTRTILTKEASIYFGIFGIFCLLGYGMKELMVLRAHIIFEKKDEFKVIKKKLGIKRILRKISLLEYQIEILPFLVLINHLEWYLVIYGIEYNLLWIIKIVKEWINN